MKKEYFFLKGIEQKGPFTIEQLYDKELNYDTLIWTEGMENWAKLKDVPELVQILKPKCTPPPPPMAAKTEITGRISVIKENNTGNIIRTNKSNLSKLILWCGFHLFALLMSYSQVKIFNNSGEPKTDKFWPFVDFTEEYQEVSAKGRELHEGKVLSVPSSEYWDNKQRFNGIFSEYDWTEFTLYIVGLLIFYLLINMSSKKASDLIIEQNE